MVSQKSATAEPKPGAAETIPKKVTFVNFLCFRLSPAFRRLPEAEQKAGIEGFEAALGDLPKDLKVRLYLSMGLRYDTDFFLWTISSEMDTAQQLMTQLVQTGLGKYLKTPYNFVAITRPSVYNPGHIPAFQKDEPPRKYLSLYPFVKSREWYLLPFEERRRIMKGHMDLGQRYPMVRLNTTYSFGLGDQDFVLAFETDQPEAFEDLVQHLRETESSRYTVRDTPFILGTFCDTSKTLMKGLGL